MFGAGVSNVAGRVDSRIATDGMATVSLSELGMSSSSQPNGTLSGKAAVKENPTPVPKVPPHLEKSYESNHNTNTHWFWRAFHSAREYLTPPTIGLIFGLVSTLTPLRGLFVVTPNPFPSPDELPPLSFLLEVTLMLGACCVPLGLTVLGASLSRLKPGRLQPMIPVLTMITTVKLAISPCIGILLVQLVLVKQLGWISVQNHILQFTLMLMSGSPTSIMCFVLAQVWDRRTKNAGSEMAALIAVQYAVATVLLTIGSASMMYFLF
ncbi:Protein M3 [Mortierella sp. NVP85]|nr:Protein M3 [Mortierella sp. NVP85]